MLCGHFPCDQSPACRLAGARWSSYPPCTTTEPTWAQRVDLRDELVLPNHLTPLRRTVTLKETCHRSAPEFPLRGKAFRSAVFRTSRNLAARHPTPVFEPMAGRLANLRSQAESNSTRCFGVVCVI